jgi:hypothetical protein
MTCIRRATLVALVLLGGAAGEAPPAAAATSSMPPFCVKRGGPLGPDSVPQLCRFYDYQGCLQAAADLNGNCVINIDYKGVVSLSPQRERRLR